MIKKLAIWIAMVALGSACGAFVLMLGLQLGLLDALPPDAQLDQFKTLYMGGTMWAWLAGTLIGAFSLMSGPRFYAVLASLPLTLPLIYSIVTLMRLM
ncbi:hypothetical protein [Micavibrio aeruginosavorus]|uniref:hypothetical protein n=1 Tax=Micavibrio aeruginosavorus TaxID=349221 RepID=UPI003F4AEBF5